MSNFVVVGHPLSGYECIATQLINWGLKSALDVRTEVLTPTEINEAICRTFNVSEREGRISEASSEITQIVPERSWRDLIDEFFNKNGRDINWVWSDSHTASLLDFWLDTAPDLFFVFVYSHPYYALMNDSGNTLSYVRCSDASCDDGNWYGYNRTLLEFHRRHPRRCLLVHSDSAVANPGRLLDCLNSVWQGAPEPGEKCVGKVPESTAESIHAEYGLMQLVASHLACDQSKNLRLYEDLQRAANLSLDEAASSHVAPDDVWRTLLKILSQARAYRMQCDTEERHESSLHTELLLVQHRCVDVQSENDLLLEQLMLAQEETEQHYHEAEQLKATYCPGLYSAAARLKESLNYKLGTEIRKSARSVWKLLFLPIVLWLVAWHHRRDQKRFPQELPPLSSYPDFDDAQKVKTHLSFLLGEAWLRHIHKPWNFLVMPWALLGAVIRFRRRRKDRGKSEAVR